MKKTKIPCPGAPKKRRIDGQPRRRLFPPRRLFFLPPSIEHTTPLRRRRQTGHQSPVFPRLKKRLFSEHELEVEAPEARKPTHRIKGGWGGVSSTPERSGQSADDRALF